MLLSDIYRIDDMISTVLRDTLNQITFGDVSKLASLGDVFQTQKELASNKKKIENKIRIKNLLITSRT